MAAVEYNIIIKNETDGDSLGKGNIEEVATKNATSPKTEKVNKKQVNKTKEFSKPFVNAGKGAFDSATGGVYGKGTQFLDPATRTLAIATLALATAQFVYKEWQQNIKSMAESDYLSVSAGGAYRGNSNIYNARVHAITGRTIGTNRNRR